MSRLNSMVVGISCGAACTTTRIRIAHSSSPTAFIHLRISSSFAKNARGCVQEIYNSVAKGVKKRCNQRIATKEAQNHKRSFCGFCASLWLFLVLLRAVRSTAADDTDDLPGINKLVYDYAKEREHHFFPGHVAVIHGSARVRVEFVVGGIVVVRGNYQLGPLGNKNWLCKVVPKLPVEVVIRHTQYRVGPAVGIDESVCHLFPANVHVRKHPNEFDIFSERGFSRWAFPISIIWRNRKTLRIAWRGHSQRNVESLRRLLSDRKPDSRPVLQFLSDWRVVHLKNDIGAGLEELRCTVHSVILRSLTWNIAAFDTIGSGGNRKRDTASICARCRRQSTSAIVPGTVRPYGLVVDDVGCMRLEVHTDMMRYGRFARPDLHGRDPGVFRDAARNGDVQPLDHIVLWICGNGELRAIHNDIRLDIPALSGPLNFRRRILRVAFLGSTVRPFGDSFDFSYFQRSIICEVTELWIRKPRKHFFRDNPGFLRFRPRAGVLVSEEGNRRDLPGPMEALTVLLQDRQDVFIKCHGLGIFLRRGSD